MQCRISVWQVSFRHQFLPSIHRIVLADSAHLQQECPQTVGLGETQLVENIKAVDFDVTL